MLDIVYFDPHTTGDAAWSGKLIGVSHYGSNRFNLPVIILLVTGDAFDWFIGFNDVDVTITKIQMEDEQFSLMGTLIAGQSETISSWRNSGLDLVVKVNEINTNASPVYADVEITFGSQDMPTLVQTLGPTRSPSKNPTDVSFILCNFCLILDSY